MKRFIYIFICISLFGCTSQKNTSIWLIGDSTMAWKKPSRAPESGWGEGLKLFTNEQATIHNHAASGRSSLSFINEGRWQVVCDSLKRGDYVIIQFGHNDEKPDTARHTEPYGSFKANLDRFIKESKAKGGTPIICSSIVRRQFNEDGSLKDTHGDYIVASKRVAEESMVPYVDMETLTRKLVTEMGPEKSKEIYNYTSRKQDSTHLNNKGAIEIARLFVDEINKQQLDLSSYFRENNLVNNSISE
ncbi:rhamnogalacturonan acetylesterase [Plebeiibacterium marinum]|uniref:Rhamnogalacturonan acetylesterase n=1 Tax=Plebeiibacterium marinum TaxID=2992111 RepID=A0AAE3MGB0_9BACT|nr:rhamnogalacturonan acetylesterase [Plebeiobacterium marinum]MCW3807117.1 rhamnogalacturonan acetylesterase [Plebeiobacterium marinum]